MVTIRKLSADPPADVLCGDALIEHSRQLARRGLAPPERIYRVEYRRRIDWTQFPAWARPVDPEMFDGCCHEG
jgi:hypothetical protein